MASSSFQIKHGPGEFDLHHSFAKQNFVHFEVYDPLSGRKGRERFRVRKMEWLKGETALRLEIILVIHRVNDEMPLSWLFSSGQMFSATRGSRWLDLNVMNE
jgi:hypothetical protein